MNLIDRSRGWRGAVRPTSPPILRPTCRLSMTHPPAGLLPVPLAPQGRSSPPALPRCGSYAFRTPRNGEVDASGYLAGSQPRPPSPCDGRLRRSGTEGPQSPSPATARVNFRPAGRAENDEPITKSRLAWRMAWTHERAVSGVVFFLFFFFVFYVYILCMYCI
jgi:hypothetical protein